MIPLHKEPVHPQHVHMPQMALYLYLAQQLVVHAVVVELAQ